MEKSKLNLLDEQDHPLVEHYDADDVDYDDSHTSKDHSRRNKGSKKSRATKSGGTGHLINRSSYSEFSRRQGFPSSIAECGLLISSKDLKDESDYDPKREGYDRAMTDVINKEMYSPKNNTMSLVNEVEYE